MVSLFCVSHASEILEERGKKLASQPGKPTDNLVYCFYTNNNNESNQALDERIWFTMIYQDLSSVLYSFIRLMIGNFFKIHFTCAITHRLLTNQNAHNYSVVVLRNW